MSMVRAWRSSDARLDAPLKEIVPIVRAYDWGSTSKQGSRVALFFVMFVHPKTMCNGGGRCYGFDCRPCAPGSGASIFGSTPLRDRWCPWVERAAATTAEQGMR
jgi:hypothetical protein